MLARLPCRSVPGALLCLLTALSAPAQRVVLPDGTGAVSPTNAWTTLRTADLQKAERPGDPTAQSARKRLMATIAELRGAQRLAQHALFHSPGPNDGLRIVNAYSADTNVTAANLTTADNIRTMLRTLADQLGEGHATRSVEAIAGEPTELFAVPGVRMAYRVQDDGVTTLLDVYAVPAGSRLQYFESSYDQRDTGARAAAEQLLGTFDGATEADFDPTLGGMILGGLLGAACGIVAALLRRRWLMRRAQAGGAA